MTVAATVTVTDHHRLISGSRQEQGQSAANSAGAVADEMAAGGPGFALAPSRR